MFKRWCAVLAAMVLLLTATVLPVSAEVSYPLDEDTAPTAQALMVVFLGNDAASDTVLHAKNPDQLIDPGTMIRVLYGLHAYDLMEQKGIALTDSVTYTPDLQERNYLETAGSGIVDADLVVNEMWTIEGLMRIAMIAPATDAVTMLTDKLAGSDAAFSAGMTELAKTIGCTNTLISNAYGTPGNLTTARDMYKILRYAMTNRPELTDLMTRNGYNVSPLAGEGKSGAATTKLFREYENDGAYYYRKTLFARADDFGNSCAAVAELDGFDALTVAIGCPEDNAVYSDVKALFRWAEKGFTYETVVRRNQPIHRVGVELAWNTDTVALVSRRDLHAVLSTQTKMTSLRNEIVVKPELLNENGNMIAAVDTDTVIATLRVYDGEILLAEEPLYAANYVPRSQILAVLDTVWTVFSSPFVLISLAVLLVLFIAYLSISVLHNRSRRKKKGKKVKRY